MLRVQSLVADYEGQPVLRGVDLTIEQGQIVCLLGPSGSGKSTLLRMIAGLESPKAGDITYGGQSLAGVPVHKRGFGLMFQDFALFPHLNVLDNVGFGLKMRGLSREERQRLIQAALELVGLSGFERREVTRLSGGEKQRVALARSLAPRPHLLMLDEPLGSLDVVLRERLVEEVRAIIKQAGLTALYVTHDQREAFAIADSIAILNAGMIEQVGEPEVIYRRPATVFTARFLGLNNVLPILNWRSQQAETALGLFAVQPPADAVLLHPDGLRLCDAGDPQAVKGRVVTRTFLGDVYQLQLEHLSGRTLMMRWHSAGAHPPAVGDHLAVKPVPESCIALRDRPPDSGRMDGFAA